MNDGTDDDPRKLFGLRLRELRRARNISQEALADDAGLDRTYISSVERGHRNISLLNIYRIAAALGVEPGDLFPKHADPASSE
jgi:transcriptional regulator with XRE-family HTH domain